MDIKKYQVSCIGRKHKCVFYCNENLIKFFTLENYINHQYEIAFGNLDKDNFCDGYMYNKPNVNLDVIKTLDVPILSNIDHDIHGGISYFEYSVCFEDLDKNKYVMTYKNNAWADFNIKNSGKKSTLLYEYVKYMHNLEKNFKSIYEKELGNHYWSYRENKLIELTDL